MTGFSREREAARQGIEGAGCEAVMAEDFPAIASSPRNACLDAIGAVDALVLIVGDRTGSVAPSGKSVVEEEFDEACRQAKPVLLFMQDPSPPSSLQPFVARASGYVSGRFRQRFATPEELAPKVAAALTHLSLRAATTAMDDLQHVLLAFDGARMSDMRIRVVIAPARHHVIDGLASPDNAKPLLLMAQAADLLAFDESTDWVTKADALVFSQPKSGVSFAPPRRQATLSENAHLVLAWAVEPASSSRDPVAAMSPLTDARALCGPVAAALAFYLEVLNRFDPYDRLTQFAFNVALAGYGHRIIEWDPKPRSSYSIPMWGSDAPVIAYPEFVAVTREQLCQGAAHAEHAVRKLVRRIDDARHL